MKLVGVCVAGGVASRVHLEACVPNVYLMCT